VHAKSRAACKAAEAKKRSAAAASAAASDGDKKPAAVQNRNAAVIDLTEWDGSREVTVLQNCVHTKITSIMNDQVALQSRVDSLRLSLTQASDFAEKHCPVMDDQNVLWRRVYKMIASLDKAQEDLEELNIEGQKMKRRAMYGLDTYIESASKGHSKRTALADIDNTGMYGKRIKVESVPAPGRKGAAEPKALAESLSTPKSATLNSEEESDAFSTPGAIGNVNGFASSPEY
jgi:small-conductance mechanosensitive channel